MEWKVWDEKEGESEVVSRDGDSNELVTIFLVRFFHDRPDSFVDPVPRCQWSAVGALKHVYCITAPLQ
jgi:hypothetical protein